LPDQSQQSNTFVIDDTLDKEIRGKTEGVQKFMHDRRWGGPKVVNLTIITVIRGRDSGQQPVHTIITANGSQRAWKPRMVLITSKHERINQ
jgi:hypothetical protein